MRQPSFVLLAAAVLTLLALVLAAPAQPWVRALLGFQLPALWTLLALVAMSRATRGGQPVPVALYLALACTLASYIYYFTVVFAGGRAS